MLGTSILSLPISWFLLSSVISAKTTTTDCLGQRTFLIQIAFYKSICEGTIIDIVVNQSVNQSTLNPIDSSCVFATLGFAFEHIERHVLHGCMVLLLASVDNPQYRCKIKTTGSTSSLNAVQAATAKGDYSFRQGSSNQLMFGQQQINMLRATFNACVTWV